MPKVLAIHHLPQMLHARRILADDQLGQVRNSANDRAGMPLQRRLAPAEQPVLVGDNLDENPVAHPRIANMRFDANDFHDSGSSDLTQRASGFASSMFSNRTK